MSNATLQVGGGNWAAQDGKLLGYAVEPTSRRYLAREFTVNRNSSKWVLGSDGYLYEVPADQPALEYYSDGTFRGALVEPQSTNELIYSAAMTTNPWILRGVSSLSTTELAPDGTSTAIKVQENDTDNNPALFYRNDVSDGSEQTFSVWLKSDSNISIPISTTGSAVGSSLSVTTEWQRFQVTQSINGNLSGPHIGGFNSITRGSGITFYAWGAQLEYSPIATSYIPTTTNAVTRLKDDIFFTNASSVIGQSEGTLFVEVDWQLTNGATQWIFSVNDSTFTNRVLLLKSAVDEYMDARVYKSGSAVWNEPYTSSLSGIQKIALTYSATGGKMYINGSEVLDDANDLSFSAGTLTDVDFGQSATSSGQANMWIRDARIYNTRLTDTQCQDLTTL